tara:strand:- start:15 stop:1838 length:1824 start_codon:yes stop_codon:yes gene_type:complete
MSNLSELLPSGAGQNQVEFVASGTLPNGKPVILNSNGTVTAIAGSGSAESIPLGSEFTFNSGESQYNTLAFDPNNSGKFILVYRDNGNSGHGTAVIGTLSGSTLSFGSEYVFNSDITVWISVAVDPNTAGKFVISYQDQNDADRGKATAGTFSGTTISFGSKVTFNSGATTYTSVDFDPNTAGKFIIAYRDRGNANQGTAVVGTLSGTTISFGSEVIFETESSTYVRIAFDPNTSGKFTVIYYNNSKGWVRSATLSGTSMSYGARAEYSSGNDGTLSFDPSTSGSFIIAYSDRTNSYYGSVVAGTVSGNTFTFGSTVVFSSGNTSGISVGFDSNHAGKFAVAFRDNAIAGKGSAVTGVVSGTTISVGSKSQINATTTEFFSVSFDPASDAKFVAAYNSGGNSGKIIVGQMSTLITNLTSTNLIGISAADAADTETAKINVWGGINSSVVPPAGALTTYAITVANASGNKYFIDTVQQDTPALTEGNTYKFDQSDSTNSGHPLRFSTTSNGSHGGGSVYSSGVTVVGTPGNAGSYTQIVVPTDAPTLYYYCTAHSGMGSSVTTPAAAALIIGSDYYVHTDGSINTTTTGGQKIGTAISTTTINMKDLT